MVPISMLQIIDGAAVLAFLSDIICRDERLTKIYGDEVYVDVFAKEVEKFGIEIDKAAKIEFSRGFVPAAKRWVVERTITCSNLFRR